MQYQYADDHGNIYQGNKKAAIRKNWERLGEIRPGDQFVAYLQENQFFAIGTVIKPRRSKQADDSTNTIADYLDGKTSHDHRTGYIYYTPVFYEDFTDTWRSPNNRLMRYAQRIDVDGWQHYVPGGIVLKGLGKMVSLPEIRKAVFEIPKGFFETVATQLAGADTDTVEKGLGHSAIDALEKTQARNQGFLIDSRLRKALETYAMEAARRHFESKGYHVEDHSANHPYDLLCMKAKRRLYVEVKGTQTKGECIFLTSGEITFARQHKQDMALFLLHSVRVSPTTKRLSKGQEVLVMPWDVDQGCLKPISYKYEMPKRSGRNGRS